MKQVTINLYSFFELDEVAQEKAINEHRAFLESMPVECEDEDGNMVEEYEEYPDNTDVVDNIAANCYTYFQDGSLAHCTTYTGKHPKSGITEFKFHGKIYDITK